MKAQMTRHSHTRMKYRCNTSKKTSQKLATKALRYGAALSDVEGDLSRLFAKIYHGGTEHSRCKTNNIRAYGDRIYVFASNILITVLPLPDEFIPQVKAITSAKKPPRPPKEILNVSKA